MIDPTLGLTFTAKRNRSGVLCVWCNELQIQQSRKEKAEQIDIFAHVDSIWPQAMAFHTVNEGQKSIQYNVDLKKQGMRSGVSDLIIPHRFGDYPFVCIELKRANKKEAAAITKEERDFLLATEASGALAFVAYGYQAAMWMLFNEIAKRQASQHNL